MEASGEYSFFQCLQYLFPSLPKPELFMFTFSLPRCKSLPWRPAIPVGRENWMSPGPGRYFLHTGWGHAFSCSLCCLGLWELYFKWIKQSQCLMTAAPKHVWPKSLIFVLQMVTCISYEIWNMCVQVYVQGPRVGSMYNLKVFPVISIYLHRRTWLLPCWESLVLYIMFLSEICVAFTTVSIYSNFHVSSS